MFKVTYRYADDYEEREEEFKTYEAAQDYVKNLFSQTDGYVEGEIFEYNLRAEFFTEMKFNFKQIN